MDISKTTISLARFIKQFRKDILSGQGILMDISFEEMTQEHVAPALEIYNYYIRNSTATFHKTELDENEMRKILFHNNPKYRSYAVLLDKCLCGYVLLTQHKVRQAFDFTAEVTLYLKHDCTGRGIGTRSLEFIEQYARTTDIHVLVSTISGENDSSCRLFQKQGYEKCAHYREVGYKFDRWVDLVVYQKIIS